MTDCFRRRIATASLFATLAVTACPGIVLAQGSAGGSIGNDDKAVSGSRQERAVERQGPARRNRDDDVPRRAPRRGGGGVSSYDGAWTVFASAGCAASGTGTVMISGGRILAQGLSGTVSPNGAIRSIGNAGGITVVSSGRITGNTGYGTYKQSDGCSGTLRAVKN